MPGGRIHTNLLTGFLGAGKTTLLNGLLRHPELKRTAVIVNEFGEIGVDHLLVARSSEQVIELTNGCLCCTMQSDLVTTLFGLYAACVNGDIPSFDRVVIETTGLAEPAPILLTLFGDRVVAPRFVLDSVLTVVDAVNGARTLDLQPESAKQIAAADRLFLSKTDLADEEVTNALKGRLDILNPGCPVVDLAAGSAVSPSVLQHIELGGANATADAQQRWIKVPDTLPHSHGSASSHTAVFDHTVEWDDFLSWVAAVRELLGPNLLRIKGLLEIAGRGGGPLVVHAVQDVFHPPEFLDAWPTSERRSRLVFITRDIDVAAVDRTLRLLGKGIHRQ
jgi:G3E family GTPase